MAVYWKGFNDESEVRYWSYSNYIWKRWSENWPSINLFAPDGTISFKNNI